LRNFLWYTLLFTVYPNCTIRTSGIFTHFIPQNQIALNHDNIEWSIRSIDHRSFARNDRLRTCLRKSWKRTLIRTKSNGAAAAPLDLGSRMTWSNLKPWTVTDSHGQSRARTEYDKPSALERTHGAGKSGFRTTTCRSEGGVSFSPASARRREREMAKPWRWRWRWRCCCEIRGGRDKRIYDIPDIADRDRCLGGDW